MHKNRMVTVSLTPEQYENVVRMSRAHGMTPAEWFARIAEPKVTRFTIDGHEGTITEVYE